MGRKPLTVLDGVLIAASLTGLILLLARSPLGIWSVVLASSAFVAIAARSVWRERSPLAVALCAGLALCWVGDVVGYRGHFEWSAGAFLVGHLAFACGFLSRGGDRRQAMRGTWAMALATGLVAAWLMPHVGPGLRLLVVAYMVVISLLVIAACGSRLSNRWLLLLAAVVFYVSDIAVARWKFVSPGPENRFFCYPLYYAACLLLALAPRWCRAPEPPTDEGASNP